MCESVIWRGVRMCSHMPATIELFERRCREDLPEKERWSANRKLRIIQGCFNAGGVALSAGTHDGGGALDSEKLTDNETIIGREVGTTTWQRGKPEDPYFDPHNHWIWIGCDRLSRDARTQVKAYKNGENGLANHGPDKSPRVSPIRTCQQALDYYSEPKDEGGIFGMTDPKKWDRAEDQLITAASGGDGAWKWLRVSDSTDKPANAYSYLSGDVALWIATIGITVEGLKVEPLQVKLVNVWDYSDDTPSKIKSSYPILEIFPSVGAAFGIYTYLNNLSNSGAPKGATMKLRLVAAVPDDCPDGVKITNIASRIAAS